MRHVLSASTILVFVLFFCFGGAADAQLRVVKGKDGPSFRHRGSSVPFSAIGKGQRQLGPYVLSQQSGTIDATRRWTFGRTKASHTRNYMADGSLFGYGRSTGSVEPGHTLRVKGWTTEQGQYDWTTRSASKNLKQIQVRGTNSKGPLESFQMVTGPMGILSTSVYRDGRPTEHSFTPPGPPRLALPAPGAH